MKNVKTMNAVVPMQKKKTLYSILRQNRIKVYVHSGVFHCDDAMSIAIIKMYLEKFNPNAKLIVRRSRNIPFNFRGLVLDQLPPEDFKGIYIDHHNPDEQIKKDYSDLPLSVTEGNYLGEITQATCGLLWEMIGFKITRHYNANGIQGMFALINAEDNGEENENGYRIHGSLSAIVRKLNPTWLEDNPDEQFEKAVQICRQNLEREIAAEEAVIKANVWLRKNIENFTYKGNKIAYIGDFKPSWGFFNLEKPDYLIWRNENGEYMSKNLFGHYFPANWWGKSKEELEKITGTGLTFCHASGFLISCTDFPSIKESLKIAINYFQSHFCSYANDYGEDNKTTLKSWD